MEKELLNKEVEVAVLFAHGASDGGSVPVKYQGTFLDCDDNYYKIDVSSTEACWAVLGSKKLATTGQTFIKKQYVIYIKEV